MCQLCLIYFNFFSIYICTKRYHGMAKYGQVNFFSNVVKYIRPTYGNKAELATLKTQLDTPYTSLKPNIFSSYLVNINSKFL